MKNIVSIAALAAVVALTGCNENTSGKSENTSIPPKISKFDCIPDTRADFVNNEFVRETSINGDVAKLTITGVSMNMHLSIYDSHVPATREFSNFRISGKEATDLLYDTGFTHNGKSYTQKVMLPIDAYEQNKFFYQRATETVSETDGQTKIAVIMAGYCYRTGSST